MFFAWIMVVVVIITPPKKESQKPVLVFIASWLAKFARPEMRKRPGGVQYGLLMNE